MEQDYFGEKGMKRVRGSKAHLASTFQGGTCCVCQELTQLHGNFCILPDKSGKRKTWLSLLVPHQEFAEPINKFPSHIWVQNATTLSSLVWEVSCPGAGPVPLTQCRAPAASTVQVVRHQLPNSSSPGMTPGSRRG